MNILETELAELVIFAAQKNNEAMWFHSQNGMERVALLSYKSALDALSEAVSVNLMIPQKNFSSWIDFRVRRLQQPMMIQDHDILGVPSNVARTVFSCVVL